jgi:hypothetical protein
MNADEVYAALYKLPANHPFWRNDWLFTRPVFTEWSAQCTDPSSFYVLFEKGSGNFRNWVKKTIKGMEL